MDDYRHHVSGFFAHRAEAEAALARLVERGLPREQIELFDASSAPPATEPQDDSSKVLQDVVTDGAIGTAVGTGVGALAGLALVASGVSLFVASPLVAPLVILGWGASLGGFIGAAAGTTGTSGDDEGKQEGTFSALVGDAILSGQVVLVAETRTEQETASAREVIEAAVGEAKDVSTA
jgi:hypothetical protein